MTGQRIGIVSIAALALLLGVFPGAVRSQPSPADLRRELSTSYDLVALQRGLALVPRDAQAGVRMIQVVDGVISFDGEVLTGQQVGERLGSDANLILQLSYLDEAGQREVAGAPQVEPAVRRTQVIEGDRVRIGGSVSVSRDERVQGDAVAVMGNVDVDGEVTGDVVAVMGNVNLGPEAVVDGDVTAVGGRVSQAPGARVSRRITEVGGRGPFVGARWRLPDLFGSFWSRAGSLAATTLRMTLLMLVGFMAVALGRPSIDRIADRTAADPMRAGLIGLASELLFVPVLLITVVVLAVSIVGIPLLALVPFGILLALLVMVVGFSAVAYHLGRLLVARFGWSGGAYAAVAVGVVAIVGLTLLGRLASLVGGFIVGAPLAGVGYLVEYLAWTVGLGATVLVLVDRSRTTPAPPAPSAAPPPASGS